MEIDDEAGVFSIDTLWCPSKGMLNELTYMEPYHDYCGHCKILYSRQLKKYGIEQEKFDMSCISDAKCSERYVLKKK